MGKGWDKGVPGVEFWEDIASASKPGAHLLSFGGSRTYHRMASAVEDAGWEIRDQIMWLYGSGFPKSLNVSKALDKANHAKRKVAEWAGWGTALKPAHEPIVVARKPLIGTITQNILAHGTGALNIEACRIGTQKEVPASPSRHLDTLTHGKYGAEDGTAGGFNPNLGRWPANVIHDGSKEVLNYFPSTNPSRKGKPRAGKSGNGWGMTATGAEYDDEGSAARFFYAAKAARSERNLGLDGKELLRVDKTHSDGRVWDIPGSHSKPRQNDHPTVKPLSLMEYLLKLVAFPKAVILDPFAGSGSTLIAAARLGIKCVGIELEERYCELAAARIRGC